MNANAKPALDVVKFRVRLAELGQPAYVVAAAVPTPPATLSAWCTGRAAPTPNQLRRLEGVLGLVPHALDPARQSTTEGASP